MTLCMCDPGVVSGMLCVFDLLEDSVQMAVTTSPTETHMHTPFCVSEDTIFPSGLVYHQTLFIDTKICLFFLPQEAKGDFTR